MVNLNNIKTRELLAEIERRKSIDCYTKIMKQYEKSLYFINDNLKLIYRDHRLNISPQGMGFITPILYNLIVSEIENEFNNGDLLQRIEPQIRQRLQKNYNTVYNAINDLDS